MIKLSHYNEKSLLRSHFSLHSIELLLYLHLAQDMSKLRLHHLTKICRLPICMMYAGTLYLSNVKWLLPKMNRLLLLRIHLDYFLDLSAV